MRPRQSRDRASTRRSAHHDETQRRVEFRRVQVRKLGRQQLNSSSEFSRIQGCGSAGDRVRAAVPASPRAHLLDRGDPRQLRVMLIRSLTGARRINAHLIQRQSSLLHALRAARKLLNPARDALIVWAFAEERAELPSHQRRPTGRPWPRRARRDPARRRSPRCAHQSRCAGRPTPPTPPTAPQDARRGVTTTQAHAVEDITPIIEPGYDKFRLPDLR